jgi:hypothetical protein
MADLRNYQARVATAGSRADAGIDEGLRTYMLKVYNLMALGLAITGLAALGTVMLATTTDPSAAVATLGNGKMLTAFGATIYGSALRWVIMLAPLAMVFFLSFRIQKMSVPAAQTAFWAYAALMGLSLSSIFLVFTGTISLANNGGFASIRARQQHHDLSGYDSVLLRVKGDGRTYQLRLYTDAYYQGKRIAYATPFQTTNDSWVELRLHFSQLQATFRGQKLSGPAFDPASIAELGFMLVDKRAGPFQLQVDWVKAI